MEGVGIGEGSEKRVGKTNGEWERGEVRGSGVQCGVVEDR